MTLNKEGEHIDIVLLTRRVVKKLEQDAMCSNHIEERLVARHSSTSRAAMTVEAEDTMQY